MYNLTYEASYPTPYASSPLLPMILLSMVSQKHTPDTTTNIKDSYDYVIVGAGSAGSIVASRLAEEKCVSVLLLEAGKSPPKVTDIPSIAATFFGTDIDWQFKSTPQKYTGNDQVDRKVVLTCGKTVGGSGVINANLHIRGNSKNYDDWSAQGAVGWDYESVLPYFKKLEKNTNQNYIKNGFHGTDGPIFVSNPPYNSKLKKAVFEYARKNGYYVGDLHAKKQSGFFDFQSTTRDGQRCSSAKGYLVPKENQENINIVSEAFVKKVIIENDKARGVVFDFQGKERQVMARKEVIVSAGGYNTPKILMLSGIGPKQELDKHNIKVLKDLPVGQNLQDHFAAILPFELDDQPILEKLTDEDNINNYINSKKGPVASAVTLATVAFLKRNGLEAVDNYPEVQLYFWESAAASITAFNAKPELYKDYYEKYGSEAIYFCLSQVLHPKGRGEVTLKSNNPYDPPIINPMYYSHSDDLDVVVQGLKFCKEISLSDPMKKIGSKMFDKVYPGCEEFINEDDKYFQCIAKSVTMSIYHSVGTAKMGSLTDPSTVVDPELRVKGIDNLRVVDASVMPLIPGGNTNVPTMMVAEKASDIIKKTIRCEERK